MKKYTFLGERIGLRGVEISPSVILWDKGEITLDYVESLMEKNASLKAENDLFSDDIRFTFGENGVSVKRTFVNKSDSILRLSELAFAFFGISFGADARDDYFYHPENTRIYENFTFPIDYKRTEDDAANSDFDVQAGTRWQDPGVVQERIGASPYQPFPAILVSNYKSELGLVHGTLSQDVFFHNYLVCHGIGAELRVYSSFKAIDYREIKCGEALIDEWYVGISRHASDLERIFEDYTKVLRKKLPTLYGASRINRDNMVWGTWNDGVFRDVSEDFVLREARALKEYFPTVEWIQIDDGYDAAFSDIAHGLGVAYEGDAGVDPVKFPNGLKHTADKIREIGLRPALWIGGSCPPKSKIFNEHLDWFIDFSYRSKSINPLDVSIGVAREYMTGALDKLVAEYGFDAVKHDFWSYAFEDSHSLYKNKDRSGYEYRKWWLSEIRKRISKDGYLQTGCDIVMGNPFLGEYFTNYRYGVDVGGGAWHCMKACFLWGAACFSTHTGDMIVPNSDAIAPLFDLPYNEFIFWTNFVLITRSGVELAGKFSREDVRASDRFYVLTKACCNPNNGQDVYFANYDYRKPGYTIPDVWYLKTALFTNESDKDFIPVRTVALFNICDMKKTVSFKLSDLGLDEGKYVLTDVWTGKKLRCNGEYKKLLHAHESQLITISRRVNNSIIDADIRMKDIRKCGKCISFRSDYAKDARVSLIGEPLDVRFEGQSIDFFFDNGALSFKVPGKGKMEIIFK